MRVCVFLAYIPDSWPYVCNISIMFSMEAEGQLWIKCPRPLEVARISTAV